MRKRKILLSIMLDELLEMVVKVKNFIFNEFDEDELLEEDLMEYIEALEYMEDVINFFN